MGRRHSGGELLLTSYVQNAMNPYFNGQDPSKINSQDSFLNVRYGGKTIF